MSFDLKPSSKGLPLAVGDDFKSRFLGWLSVASFLFAVFTVGAAVGSMSTAEWFAQEVQDRFDCVQK